MVAAKNKSNEIHLTRLYDAPVKAVWDAWADPEQVAQWWGPRGFTLTNHGKDLRPGGFWTYTMHGPDGQDYPNKTLYHEVEKYKRLVYDHGANDDQPALFRMTVLFAEVKGKTRLDLIMSFPTVEAAEDGRKFIKKANGESTWDRLAEYLAKDVHGKEQFVINRSFNIPLKVMFEMWTNPAHLSKWLPPAGFTMSILKGEIQGGSGAFYVMTDGRNITMYGRTEYLEIRPHDRITYTQQFCDKDGKVARHPMSSNWPETMLTTITFAAESDLTTRATITWECHGAVKPEELQTFVQEKRGMAFGWTGTFDKLEEYLTNF